jgi:UPF0755 protein
MTRRNRLFLLLIFLFAFAAGWIIWGPGTGFSSKTKSFIIPEGTQSAGDVMRILKEQDIVTQPLLFSVTAQLAGSWRNIRPGKYEVKKGQSLLSIARMLKNGRQASMNLVINRIRTKEEFARLISKSFAADSVSVMRYLENEDTLKRFGVDTSMAFTLIIPDTYTFYWNTPLDKIIQRLVNAQKTFWEKNGRLEKVKATGLSQQEVYILASIVDEETNYESDKYKIASVYLNRLRKSMPLQACPTIKYAMKDFTLTRIYEKYLSNPSPYNTYRKKGLPPGPICTPSPKTIDIILDAPKTDYLFFVAKSDFSGYHHFSSSYAEHDRFAKEYQKALDAYMARKQNQPAP